MTPDVNRRSLLPLVALAGVTAAVPAVAQGQAAEPKQLAERFAATLTAHDMSAFAALFADDYVNHQTSAAAPAPPAGKAPRQSTIDFFAARLAGLPDLAVSIEALVAAADKVAASFVYTGTHLGSYLGIPPTGRKLRFTSCDIFAVRDGKFVEHWGMGDIAGIMAQLKAPS
jgi:steroid delta-isomerase-like uncharacterized protein